MDHHDRLFFYTLLTGDTRPIHRYTIFQMIFVGIVLVVSALIFISYSLSQPYQRTYKDKPSAYETMSDSFLIRYWCLNWEDLENRISQELQTDFVRIQSPNSESDELLKLSQDGENETLSLRILPKPHLPDKYLAAHPEWVGNVSQICLYMEELSKQESAAYIRCIANILNPNSGSMVVRELKILSNYPLTQDRTVIVGNVSYHYYPTRNEIVIKAVKNE